MTNGKQSSFEDGLVSMLRRQAVAVSQCLTGFLVDDSNVNESDKCRKQNGF